MRLERIWSETFMEERNSSPFCSPAPAGEEEITVSNNEQHTPAEVTTIMTGWNSLRLNLWSLSQWRHVLCLVCLVFLSDAWNQIKYWEQVLAAVADLDEPWRLWGHLLPVRPAGGSTAVIWTDEGWFREGRDVCTCTNKKPHRGWRSRPKIRCWVWYSIRNSVCAMQPEAEEQNIKGNATFSAAGQSLQNTKWFN